MNARFDVVDPYADMADAVQHASAVPPSPGSRQRCGSEPRRRAPLDQRSCVARKSISTRTGAAHGARSAAGHRRESRACDGEAARGPACRSGGRRPRGIPEGPRARDLLGSSRKRGERPSKKADAEGEFFYHGICRKTAGDTTACQLSPGFPHTPGNEQLRCQRSSQCECHLPHDATRRARRALEHGAQPLPATPSVPLRSHTERVTW